MRLIILAAGQGTRLRPLTDHCPKCLVPLNGTPLLDYQIQAAQEVGIQDIIVVGGYLAEQLQRPGVRVVVNPDYEKTNMVYSLFCAEPFFGDAFILSYGDIVYSPSVLDQLLHNTTETTVVVDKDWQTYWSLRFEDPLSDAESLSIDAQGHIESIGQQEDNIEKIQAQYIGLMAFRNAGIDALKHTSDTAKKEKKTFHDTRSYNQLYMTDLLQGMIDLCYVLHPMSINGKWVEIDSLKDLKIAETQQQEGRLL
jgi:L-glutamine-phosphate cytidylyltransferase